MTLVTLVSSETNQAISLHKKSSNPSFFSTFGKRNLTHANQCDVLRAAICNSCNIFLKVIFFMPFFSLKKPKPSEYAKVFVAKCQLPDYKMSCKSTPGGRKLKTLQWNKIFNPTGQKMSQISGHFA